MTQVSHQGDRPSVRPFTIEFTAYYALLAPAQTASEPPALLLALHGWGQSCDRFVRRFIALSDRNIVVVAPQAPHQFYLDPGEKKVGFNWLTVYERDRSIVDMNRYFSRLLEAVGEEYPFDPGRVFLLGFSQGVSMAYRFAVSGLCAPAGVVACCADLAPDAAEKLASVTPFPVLLAYSEEDTVVPPEKTYEAGAVLAENGYAHELFGFSGGHKITPELVEKVGAWIEEQSVGAQ